MRQFLWLMLMVNSVCVALPAAETMPGRVSVSNFVSNLPIVILEENGSIQSESKIPCTVRMVLPKATERPGKAYSGVVRFHGASSQGYPKKSFGLTLDTPAQWLGMRESAHWVLNAAFVDRSLMRHKLSYDLFSALSTTNAPRFAAASRFVEVIDRGNYVGVYLLMERLNRTKLRLHSFATNAPQHACIYKAVDHAATFDHLGHDGFQQREPDPLLGEYWAPLDRLNQFVSSATDKDFFDPGKGISARLDLDNTIDFHLLVLLTSNMDGFDKNLILARDAPSTNAPTPRFFFAPWDYDATFGRNWEGSRVRPDAWLSNHLFDRLLTDQAYHKRFTARWKELRQKQFSLQNIGRMIDENAATLGEAAQRSAARWKAAEQYYPDHLTFKEDIAQMKAWLARRTTWLDQEIGEGR